MDRTKHVQPKTSPIWVKFKNKQAIIAMTNEYLTIAGCQANQAESDTGLTIVRTAVRSAYFMPTVRVKDNIDLDSVYRIDFQANHQAPNLADFKISD